MNVQDLEKPAEWFAELESNKDYYKKRAERLKAERDALRDAAKALLAEWDKHGENHPSTINALRDALKKKRS